MTMSIDNATPEEWDAIVQAHHAGVVAQGDDKSGHLLRRLNDALAKRFFEVPIYWRCLAFALHQQGHCVEVATKVGANSGYWSRVSCPAWHADDIYRVLPKPEELVLPSIDWSHVEPCFKWLVQDEDGSAYLIDRKPIGVGPAATRWSYGGVWLPARHFASFKPGSGDFRKLIVQRPEGLAAWE